MGSNRGFTTSILLVHPIMLPLAPLGIGTLFKCHKYVNPVQYVAYVYLHAIQRY